MESGRRFDIELDPHRGAARERGSWLLARNGYYDNPTFHRVVPNFVIQGGSPNANEYCGDCPFMRDEVGCDARAGHLGISTRGRDTGDAQIFVNLVDNARLDHDYTVFAYVCSGIASSTGSRGRSDGMSGLPRPTAAARSYRLPNHSSALLSPIAADSYP